MKTDMTKGKLVVQNTIVSFTRIEQGDFISLTDIARVKNPDEPKDVVKNWLRSRSTLDFLGLWERINNPNFKGVEFDSFKSEAGTNSFTLSPSKWIEATGAIGIRSAAGRAGGTYAHQDIAFEFASWVSAEFKLYLIKGATKTRPNKATSETTPALNNSSNAVPAGRFIGIENQMTAFIPLTSCPACAHATHRPRAGAGHAMVHRARVSMKSASSPLEPAQAAIKVIVHCAVKWIAASRLVKIKLTPSSSGVRNANHQYVLRNFGVDLLRRK